MTKEDLKKMIENLNIKFNNTENQIMSLEKEAKSIEESLASKKTLNKLFDKQYDLENKIKKLENLNIESSVFDIISSRQRIADALTNNPDYNKTIKSHSGGKKSKKTRKQKKSNKKQRKTRKH
jgi:predicted nuclease with TOPRIM domain